MTVIKVIGAGVIMIFAIVVGREYSDYAGRRAEQLRGFLYLICHIRGRISRFLAFGDGLCYGFECDALESVGFLPLVREGTNLYDAFEKCKSRLSLSGAQKKILSDFFLGFGMDYKDGELERMTDFLANYEKITERDVENMTKNVQVARALLFGGALWAGIMSL